MKKCTKCNITYTDDKKFCKKCGASLSQDYNIDPKEFAKKTVYEEKLKADSLNTDLLLEYSQFLYKNLLFKEAVLNLLKILAINENQKQANELLFRCYLKLSMYSDARDVGKQLLENNKTDIFLLEELANIETQLDNTAKAIEYYETILKIQPANTKALYSRASIFVKSKELEKAINIFKELYKEGNRDRITIIYTGIDKCLSDNYDEAIEILTPCLSEEDVSISDLNNQRGFIYLIYSLCKTKTPINKIDEWFSWLDFELLKNFMQPKDEEILAKTILEIINIHFARNKQDIASENINYVIDKYINKSSFCFTAHTNNVFAEIWAKISEPQKGLGLFSDAQASLKKAIELTPDNTEFKNKFNEVESISKQNKKQKNRKVFTIVASLTTLIIVIIISVNLFNRHNENKAWESAKQINSSKSYQDYVDRYPDGRFLNDAVFMKEDAFFNEVKESNTVKDYNNYMKAYPNGKYYKEAEYSRNNVAWMRFTNRLKDLKSFGKSDFNNSFDFIKSYNYPTEIINSDIYLLSIAIENYINGNRTFAISKFEKLISSDDTTVKQISLSFLSKPDGKRTYVTNPFEHEVWFYGSVEIKLVETLCTNNKIQVSFSIKSKGNKIDKIVFYLTKKKGNQFFESGASENVHIVDDLGNRYECISINQNGKLLKNEEYNGKSISLNEGQELIVTFEFPQIAPGATTIKFVSSEYGGWMHSWYWSNIVLKDELF